MQEKLTVVRGQHRNESAAFDFAGRVAEVLTGEDCPVDLITIEGMHAILEELPTIGVQQRREHLSDILHFFGDPTYSGYAGTFIGKPVFDFHNSPDTTMNPEDVDPQDLPITCSAYDHAIFCEYQGEDISWAYDGPISRINISQGGHIRQGGQKIWIPTLFTIELPAVYTPAEPVLCESCLPFLEEAQSRCSSLSGNIKCLINDYLALQVDAPATEEKGYMNDIRVAETAALLKRLTALYREDSQRPVETYISTKLTTS